jgi:hypothetical protein
LATFAYIFSHYIASSREIREREREREREKEKVDEFKYNSDCEAIITKMNVLLQKQGSRYYKVPEGLRELCSDIAREVHHIKSLFDFTFWFAVTSKGD